MQTGGTDGDLPIDAEQAEAVSAGDRSQQGEDLRLRAARWRWLGRPGEQALFAPPCLIRSERGQSRAWWPSSMQLKHREGLV